MADQGRPVAVVTGAANGIGAAVAARLREDGMLVVGLGIMLDGPIWLARAAGLHMARHGGGSIVNITSIHATNSERTALSYDAAKGGLEAATRTLALELAEHGVLVNSLAPGFVRTRMSVVNGVDELDTDWFRQGFVESGRLPVRRPAEPSEMASV